MARLSLPLPQLSRDRAFNDASLAFGCWPRNQFTLHKEANTSKQGCVVRQSSWTAAASPSFPFQKNNKTESSRGKRQALKALLESREAVLRQRLQGSTSEQPDSLLLWALLGLNCLPPSVTSVFSLLCDLRQSPFPLWALLNAKGSLKAEGHSLTPAML